MIGKPGTAQDIPYRVWKVAFLAFRDGFGLRYEVAIEFIARAILAERERCALIAESPWEHVDPAQAVFTDQIFAGVAAAIRRGEA